MISFAKWLIRFIAWILLYYLIITKLAKIALPTELLAINNFNLFILSISLGMSFLSSFWNKMISWKNIKYHIYSILIITAFPLLLKILNYGIELINWTSKLVDAPDIGLIKFDIYFKAISECGCHQLNPMGMAYLVITLVSLIVYFITSYEMYYWNPNNSYCGDSWDEDLE